MKEDELQSILNYLLTMHEVQMLSPLLNQSQTGGKRGTQKETVRAGVELVAKYAQ